MRPSQVLDMQADLMGRMGDRRFAATMRNWFSLDLGQQNATDAARARIRQNAEFLSEATRNHVKAAYAYRVTEDMSGLVQHAAAGLDSTDRVATALAPTGCGLVRFDRPLPVVDVRGRHMKAHWLLWGPAQVTFEGRATTYLLTSWWHDPTDPDDISATEQDEPFWSEGVAQMLGRWRWVGGDFLTDGSELGEDTFTPSDEQAALVAADGDDPTPGTNARRYVHALWLLLGQTIVTMQDEPIDRPALRRAKRLDLTPRVTVIQLRRSEGGARTEGESQIEWKHRWLVRQHWRWQPYGPRDVDHPHVYGVAEPVAGVMVAPCIVEGCGNRLERIMVHAHVKGPEGAPLKASEKVYSLER